MSQEFRKTILIVCEGKRSEPDYFHNLKNETLENNKNIFITILPIPKEEQLQIDEEVANFKLRKGAKKRSIRKAIIQEPLDYIIEDKYKAQPTCYIRKAQLAYFEKDYSELWAVYDKDGHSDHSNAYLLSKDKEVCKKTVNIGFSSISFEEWILMHFEYSTTSFIKSQCRDSDKKTFKCGTGTHELDCHGERCVIGKIIEKEYLPYTSSKNFEYKDFSKNVMVAFSNALKSRIEAVDKESFFNNNPYVSIDRLVFKLKHFDKADHIWRYSNIIKMSRDVIITYNKNDNQFILNNSSTASFILQSGSVELIDVNYNILKSNNRIVIVPNREEVILQVEKSELDTFSYVIFKVNNMDYNILDLSQLQSFT